MAIAVRSSDNISPEMNTTPLIDVMLVMLIMLIITVPLQTHAIKLDTGAGARHEAPPPVVDLRVDFDGTTLWNGRSVDRAALDGLLQSAARANPQPEIHLTADRLVQYDAVAKVLADAQRLGMKQIGFVNTDRY